MDVYILILRILHIGGAIFWVGAAFLVTTFIEPSARALGPDGGKFMQHLTGRTHYVRAMQAFGTVAVVSGVLLYERTFIRFDINPFDHDWGIVLTIGAVFGILSAAYGFSVPARISAEMGELGAQIQAGGGPPTAEQGARMGELSGKLTKSLRITSTLMAVAVICMSGFQAFI